jgi:hypothetical protein
MTHQVFQDCWHYPLGPSAAKATAQVVSGRVAILSLVGDYLSRLADTSNITAYPLCGQRLIGETVGTEYQPAARLLWDREKELHELRRDR